MTKVPATQARAIARARHVARLVRDERAALVLEVVPAVALARELDTSDGVPERRAVLDASRDGHVVARKGVGGESAPGDVVLAASERGPPVW